MYVRATATASVSSTSLSLSFYFSFSPLFPSLSRLSSFTSSLSLRRPSSPRSLALASTCFFCSHSLLTISVSFSLSLSLFLSFLLPLTSLSVQCVPRHFVVSEPASIDSPRQRLIFSCLFGQRFFWLTLFPLLYGTRNAYHVINILSMRKCIDTKLVFVYIIINILFMVSLKNLKIN